MIHPKTIFRIIGSLLLLLAGVFFLFGVVSPFLTGNALFGFLVSALSTTLVGLWCCIIGKGSKGEFSRRDSYITITVCWIAFAFFGSLPYWLGGHLPSFTDAFFESMSGFTTTGASILDDIENQPHALLLWRSLTQWLGGLGIVFFTVAIQSPIAKACPCNNCCLQGRKWCIRHLFLRLPRYTQQRLRTSLNEIYRRPYLS